ncbi:MULTISPECIES: M48 metallopeptidase family protein [Sulfurospirillum]|uniref:M48 metallopeptidase family protein n=1 Tax=Sulfurospirillum TaxID=57665 RepID=UPI00192CE737|nr:MULTISPECIES: M48 family metallopeptidase [Sulfurospirillum]WNZ00297.1 M48 family metallopeptidase [Sulfurospirillum] [Sulfurospirillum sp. 'SP']
MNQWINNSSETISSLAAKERLISKKCIKKKKILLNFELAKQPIECIKYIIVHEMIHLLERYHNDNFKSLMDKYMPNWIERKKLLEYYPLCCC